MVLTPSFHSLSLLTPLDIYFKYCDEISVLRRTGGPHFNGCRNRAKRMLSDFVSSGYEGSIIVANAGGSRFQHESNALFYYHDVLLHEGLIYDPNYTRRMPLPLADYAYKTLCPSEDIYLWIKNDPSRPIWQYKKVA